MHDRKLALPLSTLAWLVRCMDMDNTVLMDEENRTAMMINRGVIKKNERCMRLAKRRETHVEFNGSCAVHEK
jgi:hypothetical protein